MSRRILVLFLLPVLSACALTGTPAPALQEAGMRQLDTGLYVDPAMSARQQMQVLDAFMRARARITAFYGGMQSQPVIHACVTAKCMRTLGPAAVRGSTLGGRIFLSAQGLNAATISHELSHAELYARLGEARFRRVPRWFDEGLAVFLSQDADFSDASWRLVTNDGRLAPALAELRHRRGWLHYTDMPGEGRQLSYGTARQAVSDWYVVAGPRGFRTLLRGMQAGQSFAALFMETGRGARMSVR